MSGTKSSFKSAMPMPMVYDGLSAPSALVTLVNLPLPRFLKMTMRSKMDYVITSHTWIILINVKYYVVKKRRL